MGHNLRATAYCLSEKDEIAIVEAEVETDLYSKGTGNYDAFFSKAKPYLKSINVFFFGPKFHQCFDWTLPAIAVCLFCVWTERWFHALIYHMNVGLKSVYAAEFLTSCMKYR